VLLDCGASLVDAEKGLQMDEIRLESAVRPVLTSEISGLIAAATDLRDRCHEKCGVLTWLRDQLPNGGAERMTINSSAAATAAAKRPWAGLQAGARMAHR
jgi:hypothetical protein